MSFITRWQARRELRKSVKLIEKLCDEAPNSFFEQLRYIVVNQHNGAPAKDAIEARNNLMQIAARLKRA